MKTMPTLTKESEERLSTALSKVATLVDDGGEPNDAIVKVATETQLPAGQVRLMVRAFNNGRSLGHIKNHDALEEKAAAFPLADASAVLERMYPSEVATPASIKLANAVSDDYSMSPNGWLKRFEQSQVKPLEKAASDEPKAEPYQEYPQRQEKKASSQLADLRREERDFRDLLVKVSYDVTTAIDALGAYFRQPTAQHPRAVRETAVAAHGERAGALLDHAIGKNCYIKESSFQGVPTPYQQDAEPWPLVKAALDAVDAFNKVRSELEPKATALAEKRAEILRPFALGSGANVITGSVWDNQSLTKEAIGVLGAGLIGALGGTAKGLAEKHAPKSVEELVQDRLQSLGSPAHEDKLRAIRVQTMIHEMMAADPVISGYPFEDVMDAYNHLSEVAPRAMQHRVMSQALLRRYLEQSTAMDPFDVDQMLDVEGKMTERDSGGKALMQHYSPGSTRELGPPNPKPEGVALKPPPERKQSDPVKDMWTEAANYGKKPAPKPEKKEKKPETL